MKRNFLLFSGAVISLIFLIGFSSSNNFERDPNAQKQAGPYMVAGPELDNPLSSLSESFEGVTFPPAGWIKLSPDGGPGWNRQTNGTSPIPGWTGGTITVPPGGGNAVAFCTWTTGGATSNNQYLVTPQLTNIQADDSLKFWLRYWPDSFRDSIEVLISTTTPTVAAFTTLVFRKNFAELSGDTNWTQYQFRLGNFVSPGDNIYIAFRETVADNLNDGASFSLDLVEVTSAPPPFGPEPEMSLLHTPGDLNFGAFNTGNIGKQSISPFAGPGILWDGTDGCFTGGTIWGTGTTGSVNGNIGSFSGHNDLRNVASNFAGGFTSDANFDQITTAVITDSAAPTPYGINVIQKTYSNTSEEFVFVRYGFINSTGSTISDMFSGIFVDWDINEATYLTNSGGYASDRRMVYNFNVGVPQPYFGIGALDGPSGWRTTTVTPTPTVREGSFANITNLDTSTVFAPGDYRTWVGQSVPSISPGDTSWVTFAFVGGDDLNMIRQFMAQAANKAFSLGWVSSVGINPISNEIPTQYNLNQNYPNPFNPVTNINFSIPQQGLVTLKVYDLLGKEIATLVNEVTNAGTYSVPFDAGKFSSGVYFYRIESGNFVDSKKMLLIK